MIFSRSALLLSASLFFFSCGKSSNNSSSPIPSTTGSCSYDTPKVCQELYTAEAISEYKDTCSKSGGTYTASSSCKTEGRVKGCQQSLKGIKTLTTWAYDENSASSLDLTCKTPEGIEGVTTTIVTP